MVENCFYYVYWLLFSAKNNYENLRRQPKWFKGLEQRERTNGDQLFCLYNWIEGQQCKHNLLHNRGVQVKLFGCRYIITTFEKRKYVKNVYNCSKINYSIAVLFWLLCLKKGFKVFPGQHPWTTFLPCELFQTSSPAGRKSSVFLLLPYGNPVCMPCEHMAYSSLVLN